MKSQKVKRENLEDKVCVDCLAEGETKFKNNWYCEECLKEIEERREIYRLSKIRPTKDRKNAKARWND